MEATKDLSPSQLLSYWITIFISGLGLRSVIPFLEIFIGILCADGGHVTDAILWSGSERHWTAHYKWVQKGKWSWLSLVRGKVKILTGVLETLGERLLIAVIDDTVVYRSSTKAPGARYHHEHGGKVNRSEFVLGQNLVSLSIVVANGEKWRSLPLLHRLSPSIGNSGKLKGAKSILRFLKMPLGKWQKCLLLDSWYMRRSFITYAQGLGWKVVGQVRTDTALFREPSNPSRKRRGRPRKYGNQITLRSLSHLKTTKETMTLYGQEMTVEYHSQVVLARFLDGQRVRAVWVRFLKEEGPTPWRIILSTDSALSPLQILRHYEKRWSIEPMFNQLKNTFNLKEAWQQTRRVYSRWIHLLSAGYFVKELMTSCSPKTADALATHTPWWNPQEKTAGMLLYGVRRIFARLVVAECFDPKSKQFEIPEATQHEELKLAA